MVTHTEQQSQLQLNIDRVGEGSCLTRVNRFSAAGRQPEVDHTEEQMNTFH